MTYNPLTDPHVTQVKTSLHGITIRTIPWESAGLVLGDLGRIADDAHGFGGADTPCDFRVSGQDGFTAYCHTHPNTTSPHVAESEEEALSELVCDQGRGWVFMLSRPVGLPEVVTLSGLAYEVRTVLGDHLGLDEEERFRDVNAHPLSKGSLAVDRVIPESGFMLPLAIRYAPDPEDTGLVRAVVRCQTDLTEWDGPQETDDPAEVTATTGYAESGHQVYLRLALRV